MLSHITTPKTRADVLAWYVTTASIGSAIGTELSGRIVHLLQQRDSWTIVDAYHATFWLYAGIGCLNIGITLLLSTKCEASVESKTEESDFLMKQMAGEGDTSTTADAFKKPAKKSLFAQISRETRSIMYKLWFLLTLDSLADGMVGYSLTGKLTPSAGAELI